MKLGLNTLGLSNKSAGGGGVSSPYLDGVLSSAVFDIDATIAASYPGTGQTWANLIASPADGSAQTAYDFYLGADGSAGSNDPTFTGSAGDPAAYFAFDGGDWFALKSGANTTFFNDLHKNADGDSWWAAVAFQTEAAYATNSHSGLFGQIGNSSVTKGIRLSIIQNINAIRFNRYNAGADNVAISLDTLPATSTDYIFILSYNKADRTLSFWKNSSTPTYSAVTSALTGNDNANLFEVASGGNSGSNTLQAGYRYYSLAMGNEYINNTQAAAIIAHLETRHGRSYV